MIKTIKNFKWFFIVSFLCVLLGVFTFITFINQNFIFLNEKNLQYLLILDVTLLVIFLILLVKETSKLFSQYSSKKTGSKTSFNYILHMAASSHVDRSITDPMTFVYDNVVATCNILNFARKNKNLELFIYFSTDEVFGPAPKDVKYKERDRYNCTNPYSATKAGGEELAVAFQNSYNLPVFITHTMNVFGESQHPEKFIPKCIISARDQLSIDIHSDKSKTIAGSRHYIHATDVADGCVFLINNRKKFENMEKDFGGAKCPKFNLVGPIELDNLALGKLIAKSVGKELKYKMVDFHSSRPGHDLRYALSGEFMKKLGWEPKVSIEKRIDQVVKWTLKNERWLKVSKK